MIRVSRQLALFACIALTVGSRWAATVLFPIPRQNPSSSKVASGRSQSSLHILLLFLQRSFESFRTYPASSNSSNLKSLAAGLLRRIPRSQTPHRLHQVCRLWNISQSHSIENISIPLGLLSMWTRAMPPLANTIMQRRSAGEGSSDFEGWYASLDVLMSVYYTLAAMALLCAMLFTIRWSLRKARNVPIAQQTGCEPHRQGVIEERFNSEDIWTIPRCPSDPIRCHDSNVSRTNLPMASAEPIKQHAQVIRVRTISVRGVLAERAEEHSRPGFTLVSCIILAILSLPIFLISCCYVWVVLKSIVQSMMEKRHADDSALVGHSAPNSTSHQPDDFEEYELDDLHSTLSSTPPDFSNYDTFIEDYFTQRPTRVMSFLDYKNARSSTIWSNCPAFPLPRLPPTAVTARTVTEFTIPQSHHIAAAETSTIAGVEASQRQDDSAPQDDHARSQ